MKIRMVQDRTGPRHDGQAWPPRGGEIDVSDEEGAAVCEHGWAVPVAQPPAEEHAVITAPAEERAVPKTAAPRAARPRG